MKKANCLGRHVTVQATAKRVPAPSQPSFACTSVTVEATTTKLVVTPQTKKLAGQAVTVQTTGWKILFEVTRT